MKLSDIVPLLKEGDRFQADWQQKGFLGGYYFLVGKQIKIHYAMGGDGNAIFDNVNQFTANYELLPPEPKFKVGDRVKIGDSSTVKEIEYVCDMAGKKYEPCYIINGGHVRQNRLALYTPNTCSECGQEVKEWKPNILVSVEPKIEWDGGDLPKWKAFYLTWKMWGWLAENPEKLKWDWPEWKHNGGGVAVAMNECFACQYDYCGAYHQLSCCIMEDLWPRGCQTGGPFFMWEEGKDDSKHAQTIADFARDKYYEECGKEKK